MINTVASYCLKLSVAAFAIFATVTIVGLAVTFVAAFRKPLGPLGGPAAAGADPNQAKGILDALSTLVDSLSQAGPGIAALVASLVFAGIAAYIVPREAPNVAPAANANSDLPAEKK